MGLLIIVACSEDNSVTESNTQLSDLPGPLQAVITTDKGTVTIELATELVPRLAANFANLVTRKFFDGLTFYRSSTVMRQAGNPFNTEGTYYRTGYRLIPEFSADLKFDVGNVVAMPLWSDDQLADVRATEFFITVKPQDRWTFKYPIFARVIDGQDLVPGLVDGTQIESIRLKGDPTTLFEQHADMITEWNTALDARPVP